MINSIVGENTELTGNFKIDGVLRIDGKFQGKVESKNQVLIGKKGIAITELEANEIIIGGYVEGKLKINGKFKILETGGFKGEVEAEKIEIEPGGFFSGKFKTIK